MAKHPIGHDQLQGVCAGGVWMWSGPGAGWSLAVWGQCLWLSGATLFTLSHSTNISQVKKSYKE